MTLLLTLGEGNLQFHMICTAFSSSSRIFSLSFGLRIKVKKLDMIVLDLLDCKHDMDHSNFKSIIGMSSVI